MQIAGGKRATAPPTAIPRRTNGAGLTAKDLAVQRRHSAVLALLRAELRL